MQAWNCAQQATDRDLESVSAVRRVNPWICALLTTDHDPASVIPDKKRKCVTTVIFYGPIDFSIIKCRNNFLSFFLLSK